MGSAIAAEAGIGAEDVTCKMTPCDPANFDYSVVFTLAIPKADGDVPVEEADALDLLPGLERANVALVSITNGEQETDYIRPSRSAKATPSLYAYAAICALIMTAR